MEKAGLLALFTLTTAALASFNGTCTHDFLADLTCTAPAGNSTLAPSWCSSKNPFVIAKPPTTLVNASAKPHLDVVCNNNVEAPPFAPCVYLTEFVPIEIAFPINDTAKEKRKFVVYAATDGDSHSDIIVMDDKFSFVSQPVGAKGSDSEFPGRLTVMETLESRVDPDSYIIAFGGDVLPAPNRVYPPPSLCADVTCALLTFVDFNLIVSGGVFNDSGPFNTSTFRQYGFTVFPNSTFGDSKLLHVQNETYFAQVYYNLTCSTWMVSLLHLPLKPDVNVNFMLPIATWVLQLNGTSIPQANPPQLDVAEWMYNCRPDKPDIFNAFGGFFRAPVCQEASLIAVSAGGYLGVFAFNGTATGPVFVDLVLDTTPVVYALEAGNAIVDFALIQQRIPPEEYSDHNSAHPNATLPPISQELYLAVAVAPAQVTTPGSSLQVIDLPGFRVAGVPDPAAHPNNPSAQPYPRRCALDEYYDAAQQSCKAQPAQTVLSYADASFQRLETVSAAWRGLPDLVVSALVASNCTATDLPCLAKFLAKQEASTASLLLPLAELLLFNAQGGSSASSLLATIYGLRHVVFATANDGTVHIAQTVPLPSSCRAVSPTNSSVIATKVNELSLMGLPQRLRISDNAQYFLAAVSRPRYVLDTMKRSTDVCEELAEDPKDPFLANFTSMCSASPAPRYPQAADFLQLASACLPGMLCPSFSEEVVDVVPAGYYSDYGFSVQVCPPGFFCSNGQQNACPAGFQCPHTGSSLPTPCHLDENLQTTCYFQGTVAPTVCDNGTICGVPYLPPLPAPPGYVQTQIPLHGDTVYPGLHRWLDACPVGTWCGLGRSAPSATDPALSCPRDSFCTQSSVLEPTLCTDNGTCTESGCPSGHMPHCPTGSTLERLCPAGFYCPDPSTALTCSPGSYCPEGSAIWLVCPKRSYCPTPGTRIQCPDGHYCPAGSVSPIACGLLSRCKCPQGCKSQNNFTAVPVLVLLPVAALLIIAISNRMRRRRQVKRDRQVEMWAMGASRSASTLGPTMSDPLLAPDQGVRMGGVLRPKEFTVDIAFEELGLKLNGSGVAVLNGVTGEIRHGRVTAVMGPSGAGKSTFLTTLAGKAYYGVQTGTVRVNGEPQSLSATLKRQTAFVPQEDIMMRNLTVLENLRFSANTRLPSTWDKRRRLQLVYEVVTLLGLEDIKHSIIGDERVRGISGGQRKRVNIGLELTADPTVLFLDEPTSGLDSTSSNDVCRALRSVADLGLTVVAVIHQPRYEIFQRFDDVLLLGKGGRTVYLGPSKDALEYFESRGFPCPPHVNPPDHFMDVIAGHAGEEYLTANPSWKPEDLFGMWTDAQAGAMAVPASGPPAAPTPHADTIGFIPLFLLCLRRNLVSHTRNKLAFAIDNALIFTSALFIGLVYMSETLYAPPQPTEVFNGCPLALGRQCQLCLSSVQDDILPRAVMTCIAIGLTGVASFIRVLGNNRVVYWREASALPNTKFSVAYFAAHDVGMLPQTFLGPLVYCLVYLGLTAPRGAFGDYFAVLLLVYFNASGLAYIVSIVTPPDLSYLVGVVSIFANSMYAGGGPVLKVLRSKWAPLSWMPIVSFMRYALEALYVLEVREYTNIVALQHIDLADHVKDTLGFDLGAFSADLGILLGFGILWRVIAVVLLVIKDRAKKL